MKSENGKTSGSHKLLLNLSDEIDLEVNNKYIAFDILAYTMHGKIFKKIFQKQYI